ncbi:unnamed protein product [Paramecium sonneborni]|uniref:Transmembrane protein n=1 Tax=Paramecium sonneborni TaxID=65129 RepID=A0A8S1L9L6_9CILI|nr:unnamed protein product [Paramecium sonneborni]
MKNIKKCFMSFENLELEKRYQLERSQSIKKPVYTCMLCLSFICNIVAIIIRSTQRPVLSLYLNWILTLSTILQFIFVIVMRKVQFLQFGITFSSIMIGFLQLNVDQQTETKSEFYAYGNAFMQYQAVLYLISSFNHAIIQVTIHLILRILITIFQSNKIDWLLVGLGIIGGLLILIAVHQNEYRSRQNFIQNLKENQLQDVYSFIIQKPFFKISFSEGQLMFNLNTKYQIDQFPGFDQYYCDGCNIRNLMRSYIIDKKQNVESFLLSQKLQTFGQLLITFKKQTFQIKYCRVDLQQQNYLIILQEMDIQDKYKINIEKEQQKLQSFLRVNSNFRYKKLFNWGVLSIVLLNNKTIQKIDLKQVIARLINIYKKHLFPNLTIEIDCDEKNLYIYSFKNQLQIFLMQTFEIISKIQYFERKKDVFLILKRKGCDVLIKIFNINQTQFNLNFCQNFFIQRVQSLIINNIQNLDCICLEIRNHPIGSFNRQ